MVVVIRGVIDDGFLGLESLLNLGENVMFDGRPVALNTGTTIETFSDLVCGNDLMVGGALKNFVGEGCFTGAR
jgi:hypothetical protein